MTIKMFIFPCFRAVCVDVYENTGILNQMFFAFGSLNGKSWIT